MKLSLRGLLDQQSPCQTKDSDLSRQANKIGGSRCVVVVDQVNRECLGISHAIDRNMQIQFSWPPTRLLNALQMQLCILN